MSAGGLELIAPARRDALVGSTRGTGELIAVVARVSARAEGARVSDRPRRGRHPSACAACVCPRPAPPRTCWRSRNVCRTRPAKGKDSVPRAVDVPDRDEAVADRTSGTVCENSSPPKGRCLSPHPGNAPIGRAACRDFGQQPLAPKSPHEHELWGARGRSSGARDLSPRQGASRRAPERLNLHQTPSRPATGAHRGHRPPCFGRYLSRPCKPRQAGTFNRGSSTCALVSDSTIRRLGCDDGSRRPINGIGCRRRPTRRRSLHGTQSSSSALAVNVASMANRDYANEVLRFIELVDDPIRPAPGREPSLVFEHQRLSQPSRVFGARVERFQNRGCDRDWEPVELAASWRHYSHPPDRLVHRLVARRDCRSALRSSRPTPASPAAAVDRLSWI